MTAPVHRPQQEHGKIDLAAALRSTDPRTICFVGVSVSGHTRDVQYVLSYQKVGRADPCDTAELGRICAGVGEHVQEAMAVVAKNWVLELRQQPRVQSLTPGRIPAGDQVLENLLCIAFTVRFIRPTYLNHLEIADRKFEWMRSQKGPGNAAA